MIPHFYYFAIGSMDLTFSLNKTSASGKEGFCFLLKITKGKTRDDDSERRTTTSKSSGDSNWMFEERHYMYSKFFILAYAT